MPFEKQNQSQDEGNLRYWFTGITLEMLCKQQGEDEVKHTTNLLPLLIPMTIWSQSTIWEEKQHR